MIKAIVAVFFLCMSVCAFTQQPSRADLEKERAANQKEMDDLKKLLNETSKNKKASLSQLNQVQRKIQLREKQINLINQQVNLIESDINQSWREITRLKKELDTLKAQYAQSLVYSYKNRSNYDFLNFIFSAGSFNDALKRMSYLRSYRLYREQQAENIKRTQQLRQQKIAELTTNREKKSVVLKEQNTERKELEVERKAKDAVVSKLKDREKELGKELSDKKKQDMKLAVAIKAAIDRAKREAIAEANAKNKTVTESNTNKTNTSSSTVKTTIPKSSGGRAISPLEADPEAKALSDNFEKNRGSLPWPVAGNVSMRFGRQRYEGLPIDYDNPGITIETQAGASVKAVADGEVSSVTNIATIQAVIIRHGKYFTTYSNLTGVTVSRGQHVSHGQVIGRVAEKDDGKGDMDFIISNDASKNFDPEKWLR